MTTRRRFTAPGLSFVSLIFLLALGCGHDDGYYIRQSGRLVQESGIRDRAVMAAAMDARNTKAKAMLEELGESTRRHTAKVEEQVKAKAFRPAQQEFEEELAYYNEQNRIIRAYGFGQFATEFKAE